MPKQASLRFAEEAGMNTDPIYEADGKISVRKAVPFGLQHVLAMFVANIAPILIVTGVIKVPASEAGTIVQAAMIIAGIGSLLQMYPFSVWAADFLLSWESALPLFLFFV